MTGTRAEHQALFLPRRKLRLIWNELKNIFENEWLPEAVHDTSSAHRGAARATDEAVAISEPPGRMP